MLIDQVSIMLLTITILFLILFVMVAISYMVNKYDVIQKDINSIKNLLHKESDEKSQKQMANDIFNEL